MGYHFSSTTRRSDARMYEIRHIVWTLILVVLLIVLIVLVF